VRLTALDENIDDPGVKDEQEFRLKKLVYEDDVFEYEYDFGDCWEHEIEVEKVMEPEAGVRYPRCLAGERACPPEDCGGPGGRFLMIMGMRIMIIIMDGQVRILILRGLIWPR